MNIVKGRDGTLRITEVAAVPHRRTYVSCGGDTCEFCGNGSAEIVSTVQTVNTKSREVRLVLVHEVGEPGIVSGGELN